MFSNNSTYIRYVYYPFNNVTTCNQSYISYNMPICTCKMDSNLKYMKRITYLQYKQLIIHKYFLHAMNTSCMQDCSNACYNEIALVISHML